jgi:hypothetical protein
MQSTFIGQHILFYFSLNENHTSLDTYVCAMQEFFVMMIMILRENLAVGNSKIESRGGGKKKKKARESKKKQRDMFGCYGDSCSTVCVS